MNNLEYVNENYDENFVYKLEYHKCPKEFNKNLDELDCELINFDEYIEGINPFICNKCWNLEVNIDY